MKARIRNALRWKKPRLWVTVLAAMLVIAGVAACAANPAEKPEQKSGTPWDWTHTVTPEGLRGEVRRWAQNELQYALNDLQLTALCETLNAVPQDAVYPGRGYPVQNDVTLTDAEGRRYTLGFGGDCVVLFFDEETARRWEVDPVYGPAPNWEIHDEALTEFLESLTEQRTALLRLVEIPASARDGVLYCTVLLENSDLRYTLPLLHAEPSPEPQVGDTLKITFTGDLPEDGGEFTPEQILHIRVLPDDGTAGLRFPEELRERIIEPM